MEGNFISNCFSKIKNKFSNKNNYPHLDDVSFSGKELDDLSKQNMEEIDKLRHGYKIDSSDNKEKSDTSIKEEKKVRGSIIDSDKEIEIVDDDNVMGYINLSDDRRENIMKRWNSIDIVRLSNDIDKGKEILDHNYIITYADNALSYIYKIRDEYDILIEYLIGFNNEKKGIYEKSIFSDKLEDEWKYLNSYIKVLEKIKSAINR